MTEDSLLDPPPEGEGHQLTMTTTVNAGSEVEHCMFVKGPADGMLINRDLVKFTTGSHHVILYNTSYTNIPTQKDDGTAVDTSKVFDCTDGASNGWSITSVIGGSQNSDGAPGLSFPPDVAMRIRPNAVLMINAHYINASDQVLEPEIRINLYTITEEQLRVEGSVLFHYNPLISLRANGESRARMRCPVHEDITVSTVQSHMHSRGVGYAAAVMGNEPFYENDRWEEVPILRFDDGYKISGGDYFDYYCDYRNTEDRDIVQGPRTTDEMCMLIGSFWPANEQTANCMSASGAGFGGEWVGSGTGTCAETYACAQAGFTSPNALAVISECLYAAKPSVASQVSTALLCASGDVDPSIDCAAATETCNAM